MEILCFLLGIVLVYTKSVYAVLVPIITLLLRGGSLSIVWFLMGMAWSFFHQFWVNDVGMPEVRVIPDVTIQGTITSIPMANASKSQFYFAVNWLNGRAVNAFVLLSCYRHCPVFKAGQNWRFKAKLKRPENLANPGSYDFVGRLNAEHVHWVGYIKPQAAHLIEEGRQQQLLVLREKIAFDLERVIAKKSTLGIFQALTFGITTNITSAEWDLFRRTGTTHLMVISGSHIGLIAGFCYWLMKWLWSLSSRLCLWCPAAKVASVVGFLMAFIYALLAGFAPPSQRALLACLFYYLQNFISRRFTIWQAWRYGLLIVLFYEPHVVLLPGFYLSFIGVAILILINRRVECRNIKKFLIIQFACLLGLMPLTLYWFSYGAVNGFLANLLAIPVIGFLLVPLALISVLALQCFNSQILMIPIQFLTDSLLHYLHWIDTLSRFNFEFSYTTLLSPLALILVLFIVLFLPIKTLYPAAIVLVFSAVFPYYKRVNSDDFRIDVLDVGQGLSVIVNTAKHHLVYDTGMKFYHGGDMGKSAIIPFLNTLGIKKIDKVIISHPDLDHRGGLTSLEEKYPIGELIVDKVAFYHRGKSCHQYPAWQWDGVRFRFFSINKKFRDKNNSSCVLQIENSKGRVLLTGDIEKMAEDFLVQNYGNQLRSNVLLVPHHGSKTSTSLQFIKQVNPQYAVISSGFDNRYHFPHHQTVKLLEQYKIGIYDTSTCGMVTVKMAKEDKTILPSCFKSSKFSP